MSRMVKTSFDELCPYVRKAGKQNHVYWKNNYRKIYDHELLYCCKGKAYITIEDKRYDIHPGTLILVKPNKSHCFWPDQKEPGDLLWVHFDFIYRNDVYNLNKLVTNKNNILFRKELPLNSYVRPEPVLENGFTFPEVIKMKQQTLTEDIFRKIVFHFTRHEMLWQLECKVLLLQILNMVIKQSLEDKNFFTHHPAGKISDVVVRYVHHNYFRKLTLKEMANIMGLSEDYIGKVFKKETGEKFTYFVNKVRLERAKELLLHSDLSITNIAEIVGFSDVYYFSKVMKQYEGVSPSQWVLRHREWEVM